MSLPLTAFLLGLVGWALMLWTLWTAPMLGFPIPPRREFYPSTLAVIWFLVSTVLLLDGLVCMAIVLAADFIRGAV